MELSEYTSEELRAELKKRSVAKRQKKLRDRPWWIYQECAIVKKRKVPGKKGLDGFEFVMDQDYGYHNSVYGYIEGYRLSQGFGFKAGNYPKVGDKVMMRRKNYKITKNNIFGEYKICQVL